MNLVTLAEMIGILGIIQRFSEIKNAEKSLAKKPNTFDSCLDDFDSRLHAFDEFI